MRYKSELFSLLVFEDAHWLSASLLISRTDARKSCSINRLRQSLDLAKALHAAIIRQGCSVLDKNSIRTLRAFRFVTIKEGEDLRLFSHASALSRLALWLVDSTRDKLAKKAEKRKSRMEDVAHPIVVACLNEDKGTFLVVGVTGTPDFGDVQKK